MPTKHKKPDAPTDPWEAICALYVASSLAKQVARNEYDRIIRENPGNHMAPGLGTAQDILDVISTAELRLSSELARIARSNCLMVPTLVKNEPA